MDVIMSGYATVRQVIMFRIAGRFRGWYYKEKTDLVKIRSQLLWGTEIIHVDVRISTREVEMRRP